MEFSLSELKYHKQSRKTKIIKIHSKKILHFSKTAKIYIFSLDISWQEYIWRAAGQNDVTAKTIEAYT